MTAEDFLMNASFAKFHSKLSKGHKVNHNKLIDFMMTFSLEDRSFGLELLSKAHQKFKLSQMKPKRGVGSY